MIWTQELQEVHVLWFPTELDEYGQKRQSEPTVQNVKMVCHIYSQENVLDPRFVDIDVLGLTEERNITVDNEVVINDNNFGIPTGTYVVKYVIPTSRLTQVFLKRK